MLNSLLVLKTSMMNKLTSPRPGQEIWRRTHMECWMDLNGNVGHLWEEDTRPRPWLTMTLSMNNMSMKGNAWRLRRNLHIIRYTTQTLLRRMKSSQSPVNSFSLILRSSKKIKMKNIQFICYRPITKTTISCLRSTVSKLCPWISIHWIAWRLVY